MRHVPNIRKVHAVRVAVIVPTYNEAGTIVEVCAENAQLVEYGAPLFRIEAGS